MCQDTGTAIVMGKKGQGLDRGVAPPRSPGIRPIPKPICGSPVTLSMYEEVNTGQPPAQIDLAEPVTNTNFCSSPRAAAPPTKAFSSADKAVLNEIAVEISR
jgi:hypothetical protein